MKVSEFLSALEGRLPDAPVLVSETDAPDNMLFVESIVGNKDEAVLLMARPLPMTLDKYGTPVTRASRVLSEALSQGVSEQFKAKIIPSVEHPEKFRLEINGLMMWPEDFDTESEARSFARGFTFGFSVGAGLKRNADGLPTLLK